MIYLYDNNCLVIRFRSTPVSSGAQIIFYLHVSLNKEQPVISMTNKH